MKVIPACVVKAIHAVYLNADGNYTGFAPLMKVTQKWNYLRYGRLSEIKYKTFS